MKKLIALCLIVVSIMSLSTAPAFAAEAPEIKSGSAVMIDATSGQILYEVNKDTKKYPASITKIMTVYLGATLDFNKMLKASDKAIDAVPRDTSNIALDYGEEISVKDALYAAQLMSANDASNVIAEGVSGTVESFVELMNQTAVKFGANNTHFSNSNGLFDKENYTTAYDMALITMNALKSDKFSKIFCSLQYTIGKTNKKNEERNFVTQHRMVHWGQYQHLNVEGGKSGYTKESGHTLVTYGVRNGIPLIIVVMDSPNFATVYGDTEKLLEYGYNSFEYQTVTAADAGEKVDGLVTYTPTSDATFLLDKEASTDSVKYEYTKDAIYIKNADGTLLATMDVNVKEDEPLGKKVMRIVLIVLAVVAALFIIGVILLFINENKKRKKRMKKREYIKNNMK